MLAFSQTKITQMYTCTLDILMDDNVIIAGGWEKLILRLLRLIRYIYSDLFISCIIVAYEIVFKVHKSQTHVHI